MLETLSDMKVATFSELADALPYPESTVYDYLQTMKRSGYVVDEGDKLRLSTRFLEFGMRSQQAIPVFEVLKPRANELAEKTDETVSFFIREHDHCIAIYVSGGDSAVNFGLYAGLQLPLLKSAPGKAMLSQYTTDRVNRILDEASFELPSDERGPLFDELAQIETQGYARDQEDLIEGLRGVAVPVVCRGEVLGALAAGGPAVRFRESQPPEQNLPELVSEAAKKIEIEAAYASPRYR